MTNTEKVAYLKGLMKGLSIDDSTNEGKVLLQIADILEDLALSVEEIDNDLTEITELVDCLDEDLGEVEEDLYCDDDDDKCECGHHHHRHGECECGCEDEDEDAFDDEDFDDAVYEVVCPTCGDTICLNEELINEGSIECPNCGELLEFDFDEEASEAEEEEK